ncbi:4'-phosphopantetheinyl transferase family protein [Lysinibacillus mangiferihumi]|uniref:4'-phosphopantetheinyl transferase family protein n=1 Tax=Lysinibacillus mangiferihumi TaxID=1130819 RepID=UPI002285CE5F|nr:4'-phosphopantetheinyl transferase superfamily protein [Lysinibacillus mangiferihumi]
MDIEEVKLIDLEIAKFVFSKREFQDLMNTKALRRPECFYELWTLKESFVKAIGKGLSFPFDSFSMKLDSAGWRPITENNEIYYFRQYDIDISYRMAVCTKNNNFCEEVKFLTEESLSNLMLSVYQN